MATSSAPPNDGVYFIQNYRSGTVIELGNGSSVNGTAIYGYQQRALSDDLVPAQLWVITQSGTDKSVFKIENANSRTVMDLNRGNPMPQTLIFGYQPQDRNPNQRWAILRNSNNTAYVIRNQSSGTYVDLYGGRSANGTGIHGHGGEGVTTMNNNQLWVLIKA
ncbi:hypothetical protein FOMPIDRAFT_82644 [Fomitopsis schrenkii]|uniref:Ricin B lectin domain-containing protein n=1 Tax=Fomitopsis schrenkii TaxID=2126942 RepID=S8E7Y6_FOMSC|nr:hypothetical protein FOMPIDRAFT_82644 [Fomitopsis schrenkii]